jgi:hypothetical protein
MDYINNFIKPREFTINNKIFSGDVKKDEKGRIYGEGKINYTGDDKIVNYIINKKGDIFTGEIKENYPLNGVMIYENGDENIKQKYKYTGEFWSGRKVGQGTVETNGKIEDKFFSNGEMYNNKKEKDEKDKDELKEKRKNENESIKKSNNYNNPLPFLGNKNVWNTAFSRSRGGSKKSKKSRKPVKKQRKTRRHKK